MLHIVHIKFIPCIVREPLPYTGLTVGGVWWVQVIFLAKSQNGYSHSANAENLYKYLFIPHLLRERERERERERQTDRERERGG